MRLRMHSVKILAVPVIEYEMHPNSWAMQRHAIEQTTALYESIGGTDVQGSVGIFGTCHNMGTARMSADAADSVTNRWGQVHDVPNLFVCRCFHRFNHAVSWQLFISSKIRIVL